MYELWDQETHNRIGSFDTVAEARQAAAELLRLYGPEAIGSLLLAANESGQLTEVASGTELRNQASRELSFEVAFTSYLIIAEQVQWVLVSAAAFRIAPTHGTIHILPPEKPIERDERTVQRVLTELAPR